ncbi:tetratricopeptide repeat protein [Actinoalloteichus spitiensis]|uniref:tetratricopeptide repeat protein n=1 Tax=Actinoalloteichus spitiensis TaxID=252394 RepID=UPI00068C4A78|nr:tetratricopeptide repeat protein [Actinoalloteichus spitiensis]
MLRQRRPAEALRVLDRVLAENPDKPSVQVLAGRAYYYTAQLRRAEAAFAAAVEMDPTDHYARLALGRTLQRQGRLEEAQTQLRLAASMNPTPAYQEALGEVRARISLFER